MPKILVPVERPPTFEELPTKEYRDCNSCGDETLCGWWETDEDREENHGLSWRCAKCYTHEILSVCPKCGDTGVVKVNIPTGQIQSLCECKK